jgi:hypothetical protein
MLRFSYSEKTTLTERQTLQKTFATNSTFRLIKFGSGKKEKK